MKPRIPITNKSFIYRDSAHTDVRKTWERARRAAKPEPAETKTKVSPIRKVA